MNTPQKYRKKPVEIEAMQWGGTNVDDCYSWGVLPSGGAIRGSVLQCFVPMDDDEIVDTLSAEQYEHFKDIGATAALWVAANSAWLPLHTGVWIAKDRHGFYPIKADVFEATYTAVPDTDPDPVREARLGLEAARLRLRDAEHAHLEACRAAALGGAS